MNLDIALELAVPLVFGAEGFRAKAYLDTLAYPPRWTIGHGTTWVDGQPVCYGMSCTLAQANAWAAADLRTLGVEVARLVTVVINESQCAALISFSYNCGIGTFERSGVLEALNGGHYQQAADRLLEYDEAGGRAVVGLESRRGRERTLFLTGAAFKPPATTAHSVSVPVTADDLNAAELKSLDPKPAGDAGT